VISDTYSGRKQLPVKRSYQNLYIGSIESEQPFVLFFREFVFHWRSGNFSIGKLPYFDGRNHITFYLKRNNQNLKPIDALL
jgi:hypothetical protein